MRFYSQIRATKYKYLDEIYDYPYFVFTTDLIYFITRLHGLDWFPYRITEPVGVCEVLQPNCKSYLPHPLSPCTEIVKIAARNIVLSSKRDYEKIYEELVPADAENKLERFVNHINEIFEELIEKITTPFEILFKFVHVGRITVEFYKHGVKDAAHLVPSLMAYALIKMTWEISPPELFYDIRLFASEIVEWFRNAAEGEEFDEHFFENYETCEEDFDESYEECENEFDENYEECEESGEEYLEVIEDEEVNEEGMP